MRISDWSSDVCSSDLRGKHSAGSTFSTGAEGGGIFQVSRKKPPETIKPARTTRAMRVFFIKLSPATEIGVFRRCSTAMLRRPVSGTRPGNTVFLRRGDDRSEEHTSELQPLMRTSHAGFCFKK